MNEFSKSGKKRNTTKGIVRVVATQLVISIVALGVSGLSYASEAVGLIQSQEITVYKSPQCGCCDKWVGHLQENGFEVDLRMVNDTGPIKKKFGVPRKFSSCHTAVVGDYWVEGHVPADLIQKLLAEHPENIRGIAVPGMPIGSPGMESPKPMKYEVFSVDDKGNVEVYAARMGEEH